MFSSFSPSTNKTPLMTSASSDEPFSARHRVNADSISLNTIVRHACRVPEPFVILCLLRNADEITSMPMQNFLHADRLAEYVDQA